MIAFAWDADAFPNVDGAVDHLVLVLYAAGLAAVTLTRGQLSGRHLVPWWSEEICVGRRPRALPVLASKGG